MAPPLARTTCRHCDRTRRRRPACTPGLVVRRDFPWHSPGPCRPLASATHACWSSWPCSSARAPAHRRSRPSRRPAPSSAPNTTRGTSPIAGRRNRSPIRPSSAGIRAPIPRSPPRMSTRPVRPASTSSSSRGCRSTAARDATSRRRCCPPASRRASASPCSTRRRSRWAFRPASRSTWRPCCQTA